MSSEVRIAVVGAGQIGKRHIEMIGRTPGAVIAAIVDPAPGAGDLARTLGVPLFPAVQEMLARVRPHGVVIASPNQLHVEQALVCVAARVPALVEKPIAHTLEAGVRLVAAAEEANVPILVGHHRRHSAIMASALEVVRSGALGTIVAVLGTALFYKAENEGYFDGANA